MNRAQRAPGRSALRSNHNLVQQNRRCESQTLRSSCSSDACRYERPCSKRNIMSQQAIHPLKTRPEKGIVLSAAFLSGGSIMTTLVICWVCHMSMKLMQPFDTPCMQRVLGSRNDQGILGHIAALSIRLKSFPEMLPGCLASQRIHCQDHEQRGCHGCSRPT
jgi:hypothetical protein